MKNLITKFREKQERKKEAQQIEETDIIKYFEKDLSKETIEEHKNKFITGKGWAYEHDSVYDFTLPSIRDEGLSQKEVRDLFVCAYMAWNKMARCFLLVFGLPNPDENALQADCFRGIEIAYGEYNPKELSSIEFFKSKRKEINEIYPIYFESYKKLKRSYKIGKPVEEKYQKQKD
ncbi:MAG: hypothetical protein WC812_00325 [Candidatus Pacearchaeota archaeon]|jgi:hypothetical protein